MSSASAVSSVGGSASSVIKIGYIASLTGVAAGNAVRDVAGAKLAVAQINAAGGIRGKKLSLIVKDDRTDPTTAALAARDLVLTDHVSFLAGGEVSTSAAAISQVAQSLKVPYLIATAAGIGLASQPENSFTFRSWNNALIMPGPVANYAATHPFRRYAVVYADYSFGQDITNAFVAYVQRANPSATFVAKIPVGLTTTDFSAVVNQLRSANADVVFLGGIFGSTFVAFAKAAVPAGIYNGLVISFISQDDLSNLGGILPAGKQIGFNAFYSSMGTPFAKRFTSQIQKSAGHIPDGSDFIGYELVQWIKAAVQKTNSSVPAKLAAALPGLTIQSPYGPVRMRSDHEASGYYCYGAVQDLPGSSAATMKNVACRSGAPFLPPGG